MTGRRWVPAPAVVLVALTVACAGGAAADRTLPDPGVAFDYQIGGDYPPPVDVGVVTRDWFSGNALTAPGTYSICYVNAFQTQDDEPGVDRPDSRSRWPADLVLTDLGDDPAWGGEYLVDIGTAEQRGRALGHVAPMIDACADGGFDAVELDNLDSWTRFDGTPPSYRPQCAASTDVYGDDVVVVEYDDAGFSRACAAVGDRVAVVRRDVGVSVPGSEGYRFASC